MVYDPKRGCVRGEEEFRELEELFPMPECQPPREEELTFERLRESDYLRAITAFKHDEGLVDWSPAEWSNAMAGEAGEACNLTKKILRGDTVDINDLSDEIADVVIYADLLATRMGLKLEDCVRRKFNKVSAKKGSDIRL